MFLPVIMSGGGGTRLWPLSREKLPKQFLNIFNESLLEKTIRRLQPFGDPWFLTVSKLKDLTEKSGRQINLSNSRYLYEPFGRNTAPAIALLCHILMQENKEDQIIGIFPADHLIEHTNGFESVLRKAIDEASQSRIVTFGIQPTFPSTGYGYIQVQMQESAIPQNLFPYPVERFHEKPSVEAAQAFIKAGHYFWNAGIFVFKVSVMAELFELHQPQMWKQITQTSKNLSNLAEIYNSVADISIDYAIMEKLTAEQLTCIPGDFGWSDVGSWDSVAELLIKESGARPQELQINGRNNFAYDHADKFVAFLGVDDTIVINTDDALLVTKKGNSQEVRKIVDWLKINRPKLTQEHTYEERPWGHYQVLKDANHFKSKVIRVDLDQQISYQSHDRREEHWLVVSGSGEVILNDKIIPVQRGTYVHIPLGAKHRIRNTGSQPLEFVEVQLGSYFGEDDIVRYQDDYQRL